MEFQLRNWLNQIDKENIESFPKKRGLSHLTLIDDNVKLNKRVIL
jgi:hypothetical protein